MVNDYLLFCTEGSNMMFHCAQNVTHIEQDNTCVTGEEGRREVVL